MISVGEQIPDVRLTAIIGDTETEISTREFLSQGKVVLFSVPGAFTPTCSDYHLPGFVIFSDQILEKGVERIACVAVNDKFVMKAWGKTQNVGEEIAMIADGNAEFTEALGLAMDGRAFGMGVRAKRYAMIIEDGKVTSLDIEPAGGVTVSGADAILAKL